MRRKERLTGRYRHIKGKETGHKISFLKSLVLLPSFIGRVKVKKGKIFVSHPS